MARSTGRALQRAEHTGAAISENLSQQLAVLRKQVDQLSHSVHDYSDNSFDDLQHNAAALAREVRHQGRAVARQVGRQAHVAGDAVRENPVPVVIALGTIALLSALVFSRR